MLAASQAANEPRRILKMAGMLVRPFLACGAVWFILLPAIAVGATQPPVTSSRLISAPVINWNKTLFFLPGAVTAVKVIHWSVSNLKRTTTILGAMIPLIFLLDTFNISPSWVVLSARDIARADRGV